MSFNSPADPLRDFSGQARLFPLPNLVLFPHVVQPLHIFELRYREMLEEALASDRLLVMALLLPGWEDDYEGRPKVDPVGCVGRVMTHKQLEDGTYNLLLAGLRRVRILSERPPEKSFREAEVELLEDVYIEGNEQRGLLLARRLLDELRAKLGGSSLGKEQVEQLRSRQAPLGMLADILAYSLPLKPEDKQSLLAELNVDQRAERVLHWLTHLDEQNAAPSRPPYPFDVSDN